MKYFLLSFDILEMYWVEISGGRVYQWKFKERSTKLVEADSYEDAVYKLEGNMSDFKIANIRNDTL